MKQLLSLICCLCFSLISVSQITNAEYFFDTDPGFGNGVPLTVSGNEIDEDFNLPTVGLSEGVHKLYVRVLKNDGIWSLYAESVFYVRQNPNTEMIMAAEYFFDVDPGFGNGTSLVVSGNEIDEDLNISTVGLSEGVHKLYVRVLKSDGLWSLYDSQVVYIRPNINTVSIVSAEYFIDIDPGVGNAISIDVTGGALIDEDLSLDMPTDLSEGDHIVYFRVLNDNDTWSLYASSEVSTTLSNNEFSLNAFKLYPNPLKDILYVDTNNQEIIDFKIIDFTGKIIYNSIPNNNQLNIDWLQSGTYLVQLSTENGSASKKIIKK